MNIRFYQDPETGLPHIYNHNVNEDEVEQVLLNPGEDWKGSRKLGMHSGKHKMDAICKLSMFETHNLTVFL